MRVKHWTKLLSLTGACALGTAAHAATNVLDFNTDPVASGLYTEPGSGTNAEWRQSGGKSGGANDGYLSVTDARGSQRGVLLFRDLENGLILKSFIFECDLRMGGGHSNPADGFSLNFANASDPLTTGADNFAGVDAEASLPEEGSRTGLGIGFDTWQSSGGTGGLGGTGGVRTGPNQDPSGIQDVVGISIRANGTLIAQLPVPINASNIFRPTDPNPGSQGNAYTYNPVPYRNLPTNDVNYRYSMQTGARADVNGDGVVNDSDNIAQPAFGDPNWGLWVTNLTWEKFRAEVDETGKVKLFFKGFEVTPPGGLASTFAPQAGRLVFGARTGGNWQTHHVDNILLITQPFTSAVVQAVRGNGGGFVVEFLDQAGAQINTNTIVIKLDNTTVAPSSVFQNGLVTTFVYKAPTPLATGTRNLNIQFDDNVGFHSSADRTFTVAAFTSVGTTFKMPDGSVNTGTPGFNYNTYMQRGDRFNDANRVAQAERQLYRGFLDPLTGLPFDNLATTQPVGVVQYINFNQDATHQVVIDNGDGTFTTNNVGGQIGSFQSGNTGTTQVSDAPIPGLTPNGSTDTNNNIVTEFTAWLDIPAGFYTFGVNSDDGFRAAFGWNNEDVFGQQLGVFDGGKGASDVTFDVYVPNAGVYPLRLLWWEGGGGANVEFFYIDPTTQNKILVNDIAHGSTIKAYTTASANVRPAITTLKPARGEIYVLPDAKLEVTFTDGNIPLNDNSVVVRISDSVTPSRVVNTTKVRTGGTTTFSAYGSLSNLLQKGVNNISVEWNFTENGNTVNVTNSTSFRVLDYGIVPPAFKVAVENVSQGLAGFRARVAQIYRRPVGTTLGAGNANQAGNTAQGDNDSFPGDANRLPRPEYLLAGNVYYDPATGQPYPNVAIPDPFDGDFTYDMFVLLNLNDTLTGTAPSQSITHPASGVFTPTSQPAYPEQSFPGIPDTTGVDTNRSNGGLDNVAYEFMAYVWLQQGSQTFAVNSDDGFLCTVGSTPSDKAGVMLGHASLGRGNAGFPLPEPTGNAFANPGNNSGNTIFAAVAAEEGFYPMRVVYWNGGGGINMEFIALSKTNMGATSIPSPGGGAPAQNDRYLVGDTTATWNNAAFPSLNAGAAELNRAYAISTPVPTQWDRRWMQTKVGFPKVWGNTPNSRDGGDVAPPGDNTRAWADQEVGAIFANGAGKTFRLQIDGADVTPTVTTTGTNTTVAYKPNPIFASNSTHIASLIYEGGTSVWNFQIVPYTTLPNTNALPLSSNVLGTRGFSMKLVQHAAARGSATNASGAAINVTNEFGIFGTGNNTVEGAEASLAGSPASIASPNTNRTDGRWIIPVVNFNNNKNGNATTYTPVGNFQTNTLAGWPYEKIGDQAFPGLSTTAGGNSQIAAEIFAYLQFDTAGYKKMGINADDGGGVKLGLPGQTNGFRVFAVDRGSGATDIPFSFVIPTPGLYPMRLIYYDGGGGGQAEFYSYDDNDNKIPVNSDQAGAIKAYYVMGVGSSRVDLQACKLEYSIVSPK